MKLLIVLVAACSCFPYILTDNDAAAAAAAAAASGDSAAAAAAAAASGDSAAAAAAAAASGSGGSSHVPCRCPDYLRTVCGSDNVSYRNICWLRCQSYINKLKGLPPVNFKHLGACHDEACGCNFLWDPVCGSDGKTYPNLCLLRCENRRRYALGLPRIWVAYRGKCVNCICPAVWDPVCASDGKTYGNRCLLRCENEIRRRKGLPPLYIKHRGECICICKHCTRFWKPVCGSDNRTYSNICWLNCKSQCNIKSGLPPIYVVKNGVC